jgi:hypothetical protein
LAAKHSLPILQSQRRAAKTRIPTSAAEETMEFDTIVARARLQYFLLAGTCRSRFANFTTRRIAMRRFDISLLLLALSAAPLAAQDHQTATASVSIGADLEVLDRPAGLILSSEGFGYSSLELVPAVGTATAESDGVADMLALDIAYGLWGRARARVLASNDTARAEARAYPRFGVLNDLDTPLDLRLQLRVPGAFPMPGSMPPVPNAYDYSGEVDSNWAEIAQTTQRVAILGSPEIGLPIYVLDNRRETRPSVPPPGIPNGPVNFNAFGVPFTREFTVRVPSSVIVTETEDEILVEFVWYAIGLWVLAEARAVSILEGTASEPVTFDEPELCELAPPRHLIPGLLERDRLCRTLGAGSPICSCLRDNALRNQRCTFTFRDFFLSQQFIAPALAGQEVQVEWTLLPWMTGEGEYWLSPEILVNGKWIPIAANKKLGGKLTQGKEARTKASFTMPSRPTILRTRMFHQPKGAKQPIESEMQTMVALRKPKLKEQ